jgi:hypothetical protein
MGLNLTSYLMGVHYLQRRRLRYQGKSKSTFAPRTRDDGEIQKGVADGRSRAENLARAQALEGQGRLRDARDLYTKCVDITPEMALQLIKVSSLSLLLCHVRKLMVGFESRECRLRRSTLRSGCSTLFPRTRRLCRWNHY